MLVKFASTVVVTAAATASLAAPAAAATLRCTGTWGATALLDAEAGTFNLRSPGGQPTPYVIDRVVTTDDRVEYWAADDAAELVIGEPGVGRWLVQNGQTWALNLGCTELDQ
jgi:hypothetical protein